MQIVLLDDDEEFREAATKWVASLNSSKSQDHHYEIFATSDEAQFLNRLAAVQTANRKTIALIDLDMMGEKTAGLDTLKKLRGHSDEKTRIIPAVIYSNSAEIEEVFASYKSCANSFVWKGEGHNQRARFKEVVGFWDKYASSPTVSE